jgi:lysophospholipase L1-like esterase
MGGSAACLMSSAIPALVILIGLITRYHWIRKKVAALEGLGADGNRVFSTLPERTGEKRLLLLGDSRISQWPKAAGPDGWDLVNRGIAGKFTSQLKRQLPSDIVDADIVVLEVGVNDLVAASFLRRDRGARIVEKVIEDIEAISAHLAGDGVRVVVLTIIPPGRVGWLRRLVWRGRVRDYVAVTNAELRAKRWGRGIGLLDLAPVLDTLDDRLLPDRYRADTLHLNSAAYLRLKEAVSKEVMRP